MAESVLDSLTKKVDQLETTKAVTVNADVSDAQSKIERLASTLESVAKKAEDLAKNTLDVGNSIKTWKSAEDLQKAQDASGDMADLVEKLKKMSEHTGKLKENLEGLTSKTWTINVVYKETKQ